MNGTFSAAKRIPLSSWSDDGKLYTGGIAEEIVNGCNLNCPHCHSYAPFRKGMISLGEHRRTNEEWAKRITIPGYAMTGGEPLLHPEIAGIVKQSHDIWNARQSLWTNGILLNRQSETFFENCRETGTAIFVSLKAYQGFCDGLKIVLAGIQRCESFGVKVMLRHSHLFRSWNADIPTDAIRETVSKLQREVMIPQPLRVKDEELYSIDENGNAMESCRSQIEYRRCGARNVGSYYKNGENIYYCFKPSALVGTDKLKRGAWAMYYNQPGDFIHFNDSDEKMMRFIENRHKNKKTCETCEVLGNAEKYLDKKYSEISGDWTRIDSSKLTELMNLI